MRDFIFVSFVFVVLSGMFWAIRWVWLNLK